MFMIYASVDPTLTRQTAKANSSPSSTYPVQNAHDTGGSCTPKDTKRTGLAERRVAAQWRENDCHLENIP